MSAAAVEAAARKPTAPPALSTGHSPSSSPNHTNPQRRSVTTGSPLGAGMGSANGVKVLNSGWQVWGNSSSAARNIPTSSGANLPDHSVPQSDPSYRSTLGDTWGSRPISGAWDEMADSMPSQLDARSSLSLQQARQRNPTTAQSGALSSPSTSLSKHDPFSPQRYSAGLGKEAVAPARYPPVSPGKSVYDASLSPFAAQQPLQQSSSPSAAYDSLQTSSFVDEGLSVALRGMAVADDYSSQHNQAFRQSGAASQSSTLTSQAAEPSAPQMRTSPQVQQPRMPYNGYPQADYSAYYSGPSTRVDWQYSYDAFGQPTDPSLYAPSPALSTATIAPTVYSGMGPQSLHPHNQQSGVFYNFSGSPRSMGSQYYYPAQPMVYQHPPPSPLDKKRDSLYNLQQQHQIPPHNVMYANYRSSPSPHLQGYAQIMDYNSPLPLMLPPGAVYGHPGMAPPALHQVATSQFPHQSQHHRGPRLRPDHRVAIRSALLDEFRSNKSRNWELSEIWGYVVEFSGDQHGSRFIQQKIETATSEEKQKIFDEIVPHSTLQLIQDVFGNYVIQKLFEYGTQVQKTILANAMEGHILPLSLQMYGCRVVQKAIEYILPEQQSVFVKELEANALRLVKDANGNHVVQKLIERVPPERLELLKAFKGNVYDLATHPYGCRVLQRCFEHLPEEYIRPLLDELHKHVTFLMQDQFGNYVVQFVLEHGKPHDRGLVVSKLQGQMLDMARHKFASNVCEKALVTADSESRRQMIDELLTVRHDGLSPVMIMMKDQYANYVLQRALSVVEGEQKAVLIAKVRPQLINMRRYSSAYSKHLIAIERLIGKQSSSTNGDSAPKENNGANAAGAQPDASSA